MKNWVLNGDVLEVGDGNVRIPVSAKQILSSIVQLNSIFPDLPTGKCGDANSIQFAKFPVDIYVLLESDDSGLPVLNFVAKSQNSEMFAVSDKAIAHGHVVNNNTWFPVFSENTEVISDLLRKVEFCPLENRPKNMSGYLLLKTLAAEGGPVIDKLSSDALTNLALAIDLGDGPEGIEANLYPYQNDGWRWLSFVLRENVGGILADEMGLGKTLQVISAIRDPGRNSFFERVLIVAPGSLLENWMRELKKFWPDVHAHKHHGSMRTGLPSDLQKYQIIVTSYETVVRDLSLMKMVNWSAVVIDEAQNIRNPNAIRTTSIKQLRRRVGLAVTGTPIENRLQDLWSIMDFVVPGYLGSLKEFEARFADDAESAARLEPLVTPLLLRRLVSDVANDLPDCIQIPEFLEMNELESSHYEQLRIKIVEDYGKQANLVSIGKLRQYCCHPNILKNMDFNWVNSFSKLDRLKELLEEVFIRDEKALIFTSYTKMSDLISRTVSQVFGVMVASLDGRLEIDQRQNLIDRFSDHSGPALLVLNPRAGGSGLNITAANHVIHYNLEWNPALEDQASARAYRLGQELPVTIHRLIYSNTVEEVINQRLERKRELAGSAIVEGMIEEGYATEILAALELSPFSKCGNSN